MGRQLASGCGSRPVRRRRSAQTGCRRRARSGRVRARVCCSDAYCAGARLKPPGSITPVMPRRLSSEKNWRVPREVSASVGLGRRSNSAADPTISLCSQPVGLPLRVSCAVSLGGRASGAMPSASRRFRCQQQARIEELYPHRVVWRGRQHFLGVGRRRSFELLLGPAAGDHQPGAGRDARPARAQARHRLGDRAASIQLTSTNSSARRAQHECANRSARESTCGRRRRMVRVRGPASLRTSALAPTARSSALANRDPGTMRTVRRA
jgi:hypothetical protein